MTNSQSSQPTGKTKQKMLNGLFDIYEDWKTKLDKLGQPYYLKVWLFEPYFTKSQVVCAIGDNIDFYENTFSKANNNRTLKLDNYGTFKNRLSNLKWDYRIDEDHYDNTQVGGPEDYQTIQDYLDTVKWFSRLMKKPHQTHKLKEPMGEITEIYSIKKGDIWLGGQK